MGTSKATNLPAHKGLRVSGSSPIPTPGERRRLKKSLSRAETFLRNVEIGYAKAAGKPAKRQLSLEGVNVTIADDVHLTVPDNGGEKVAQLVSQIGELDQENAKAVQAAFQAIDDEEQRVAALDRVEDTRLDTGLLAEVLAGPRPMVSLLLAAMAWVRQSDTPRVRF